MKRICFTLAIALLCASLSIPAAHARGEKAAKDADIVGASAQGAKGGDLVATDGELKASDGGDLVVADGALDAAKGGDLVVADGALDAAKGGDLVATDGALDAAKGGDLVVADGELKASDGGDLVATGGDSGAAEDDAAPDFIGIDDIYDIGKLEEPFALTNKKRTEQGITVKKNRVQLPLGAIESIAAELPGVFWRKADHDPELIQTFLTALERASTTKGPLKYSGRLAGLYITLRSKADEVYELMILASEGSDVVRVHIARGADSPSDDEYPALYRSSALRDAVMKMADWRAVEPSRIKQARTITMQRCDDAGNVRGPLVTMDEGTKLDFIKTVLDETRLAGADDIDGVRHSGGVKLDVTLDDGETISCVYGSCCAQLGMEGSLYMFPKGINEFMERQIFASLGDPHAPSAEAGTGD